MTKLAAMTMLCTPPAAGLIFAAAVGAGIPGLAHAGATGFDGATVELTARVTNLPGCKHQILSNPISSTVGSGVEFRPADLSSLRFDVNAGCRYRLSVVGFAVDVSDRWIKITFDQAPPGSFGRAAFNGFNLRVVSGAVPKILGVSSNTSSLVGIPVLSVGDSASAGIDVNVSGLQYSRESTITIDFEFDGALSDDRHPGSGDEYSRLLSDKIDEIVDALNGELGLPSEEEYASPEFDQEAYLTRLGRIVERNLESAPCKYEYQIEFESKPSLFPCTDRHSMTMCGEDEFVEGFWSAEDSILSINTGNLALAVEAKRNLAHVDSRVRSIRNISIDNVLHETFHYYQDCLISMRQAGALSDGDQRYRQVQVWEVNKRNRLPPVDCEEIEHPDRVCATFNAYKQQPSESSARYFAEEVRRRWMK